MGRSSEESSQQTAAVWHQAEVTWQSAGIDGVPGLRVRKDLQARPPKLG